MLTESLPKISCLMVTAKNRLEYLKLSFRCYCDQTYPNRELIILNEGPPEYQQAIEELVAGRDDVNCIWLNGKYTLGALRNIAVVLSSGDIWMQWDDDDFNLPERIATQYTFFRGKPKAVACFLSDQLHYYFGTKTIFWEDWWGYHGGNLKRFSLIPGTIMAYKDAFTYRYPSRGEFCNAAEDSVLTGQLCNGGEDMIELLSQRGYMQVYSYHGKNVWDLQHHMYISQYRSMPVEVMNKHRERILASLRYLKLADEVQVMGREGLAFTYREGES